MSQDNSSISVERAARLLATLLVTPDEHLEAYRAEFLGPRSSVSLERLKRARALSLVLADALADVDHVRLEAILEQLDLVTKPRPDPSPKSPRDDEGTASIGDYSPLAGSELPFRSSASATPPKPAADDVAREAEAGETVAIGEMSPLLALATGRSVPSHRTELSLEQYACLCAALQVHPERRAATLNAYGLTVVTHRELEQMWTQRLGADPQLAQRFHALVNHYRAWAQSLSSG